jgi:hypothetical protein
MLKQVPQRAVFQAQRVPFSLDFTPDTVRFTGIRRCRNCSCGRCSMPGKTDSPCCPPEAALSRGFLCLRRARGLIPLASPVARFLPWSADCPGRTPTAVWGGAAQGSATRRNRDCAASCVRTEGAGRSSLCPPEAALHAAFAGCRMAGYTKRRPCT